MDSRRNNCRLFDVNLVKLIRFVLMLPVILGAGPLLYGNTEVLPRSCEQVKVQAAEYLMQHGIESQFNDWTASLKGEHIRSGSGKPLGTTWIAIKKYTLPQPGSVQFPSWMTYGDFTLSGRLALKTVEGGCRVDLTYDYRAYATQWVVIVPADGGWEAFKSNSRLESEHLLGTKRVMVEKTTALPRGSE